MKMANQQALSEKEYMKAVRHQSSRELRVLFCWSGFPPYAALCIKNFCIRNPEIKVQVICTKPGVPYRNLSEDFPAEVSIISPNQEKGLDGIIVGQPMVAFQTNYSIKSFRKINSILRKRNVPVILASDHNWTGKLRQRLFDYVRHQLVYQHMFDGVFVPGAAGKLYHERMGYKSNKIYEGLYGADPQLFFPKSNLNEKPKRFLFIGQLVKRKNVLRLADAFDLAFESEGEWKLAICGAGPLAEKLHARKNIDVLGFLQPVEIAELMRVCPILILPSLEEHWGVVVHEGALSGACLALSQEVGSIPDLATTENSVTFDPRSVQDIATALREVADWSKEQRCRGSKVSLQLAKNYGPETFSLEVEKILRDFSR